ncbi:hypothetical protein HanHA300_Chr16g0615451 [Helianthus annuus]|nr:hypothetical protein HanHA300_Chr16g0615451 [Helianthus annuus]KAJ0443384.1 hypothetical protein HanIR_Chr16g0820151 [Helianthus annuus]KAJ0444319.1 hypothetical protein HanIR_Chr16g0830561 [Helianthus annuus]KAJ0460903.1 hypothetical protein HanHA89_Chr16g0666241 [Helianthus annuus]KAJ0508151.1 hypothetical protein HanIR_Chr11g0514121 [Helianthus annuus]
MAIASSPHEEETTFTFRRYCGNYIPVFSYYFILQFYSLLKSCVFQANNKEIGCFVYGATVLKNITTAI